MHPEADGTADSETTNGRHGPDHTATQWLSILPMQRGVRLRRLCSSLEALAVLFGHAELDGGCRCCRWRVGLLLVEMRKAAPAREHGAFARGACAAEATYFCNSGIDSSWDRKRADSIRLKAPHIKVNENNLRRLLSQWFAETPPTRPPARQPQSDGIGSDGCSGSF